MQTRTHAQKYFKKLAKQQDRCVVRLHIPFTSICVNGFVLKVDGDDVDLNESRWSLMNNDEDVFKDLELETPADVSGDASLSLILIHGDRNERSTWSANVEVDPQVYPVPTPQADVVRICW